MAASFSQFIHFFFACFPHEYEETVSKHRFYHKIIVFLADFEDNSYFWR
jgi:hypothetical protein